MPAFTQDLTGFARCDLVRAGEHTTEEGRAYAFACVLASNDGFECEVLGLSGARRFTRQDYQDILGEIRKLGYRWYRFERRNMKYGERKTRRPTGL